jgi:hypothetical protein
VKIDKKKEIFLERKRRKKKRIKSGRLNGKNEVI